MDALPASPVVGVSSDRREAYCLQRLPGAVMRPIRGTIEQRLAQLDAGDFDAILMAGAALNRLGLTDRVTEWVALDELPVPAGQGFLAVTFRQGDPFWMRVRGLFVKAVRFVGAGVGSADFCTLAGRRALEEAEVCLYDVLMDEALLKFLPVDAERIFVGKRCGDHAYAQDEITRLIADQARRGRRVVRLKGGDPGLFGRLAEEIDALDALALPYKVYAGVSALTVATTGTGMLLTRSGVSRGFPAMTPRAERDAVAGVALTERSRLPIALFMSVRVADQVGRQLLDEGWAAETPAAVAFDAGGEAERVVRLTLGELAGGVLAGAAGDEEAPGLLVIGAAAGTAYPSAGALRGRRVLLTCSEAIMEKAVRRVVDFGGVPVVRPLIRLVETGEAADQVARIEHFDWVVLTSPSAVRCFMDLLARTGVDVRRLPAIMTCGPGTCDAFRPYGIVPELTPAMDYSAVGLAATLAGYDFAGKRILRLRSDKAGGLLADTLRERGAEVEDVLLYANEAVFYERPPVFDAVFFASASAVEIFFDQWGGGALVGRTVCVIGRPTADALLARGRTPEVMAEVATVDGAISALACRSVRDDGSD